MAIEGVAGVVRSGSRIKVEFTPGRGCDPSDNTLEGIFVGVGADLVDGEPILLVDEGKDTDQSVALIRVTNIEGGGDDGAAA